MSTRRRKGRLDGGSHLRHVEARGRTGGAGLQGCRAAGLQDLRMRSLCQAAEGTATVSALGPVAIQSRRGTESHMWAGDAEPSSAAATPSPLPFGGVVVGTEVRAAAEPCAREVQPLVGALGANGR